MSISNWISRFIFSIRVFYLFLLLMIFDDARKKGNMWKRKIETRIFLTKFARCYEKKLQFQLLNESQGKSLFAFLSIFIVLISIVAFDDVFRLRSFMTSQLLF